MYFLASVASIRMSVIAQGHGMDLIHKPRKGLLVEEKQREGGDRHRVDRSLQSGGRFVILISLLLRRKTFYLWGF